MSQSLAATDNQTWQQLYSATADAKNPFRNLTLCSIDRHRRPQARMVVLRRVVVADRLLEFHTDIRSDKWQQLLECPQVCVHGYHSDKRLQVRLAGTVSVHTQGSDAAASAWQTLTPWTRASYCGGPPGDPAAQPRVFSKAPAASEIASGESVFGVIVFKTESLDWFTHPRGNLQRALFSYGSDGTVEQAAWVTP